MAAYCTQQDLAERFGNPELAQLTDPAATSPVPTQIDWACAEASSMIDSYAGARYTVPLSPVPSIVKKWACDLARRFLWKERAKADSGVILAYNETVGALKDLSRGLVSLPASDAGAPPVSSGAEIAVAAVSEVFTPDVLARMPGNLGDSGSGDWESLTP